MRRGRRVEGGSYGGEVSVEEDGMEDAYVAKGVRLVAHQIHCASFKTDR